MPAPIIALAAGFALGTTWAQWPVPDGAAAPEQRANRAAHRAALLPLARQLDRRGAAGAAPPLRAFLDDLDIGARVLAARALVRAGDPVAIDRAVAWLDGGAPDLVLGALQALRALPGPGLPPALAERLGELTSHPQGSVRLAALHLLEERGELLSTDLARRALRDELAEARCLGLRAIARSGDSHLLALVVEALADPDDGVRATAAHALGRLGDPRAVPPLARRLTPGPAGPGEPAMVRAALAQGLAELGGPAAAAALAAQLHDRRSDEGVRAAILGLGRLAAHAGAAPADSLSPPPGSPAPPATPDEAALAAARALAALLDRLDGFAPWDPLAAAVDHALAQGGARAARALGERLHDQAGRGDGRPGLPGDARLVAILEAIGDEEAVHALLRLLHEASPALPAALDALARLCAPAAGDDLRLLAREDPSPAIRDHAVRTLTALDDCSARRDPPRGPPGAAPPRSSTGALD